MTVSPLCRPSWAWPLGLPVPELPDFVVVEVENAREVQLRDLRDHGIYLRLETGVASEEYELVRKLKELVGPHRRELFRILEELGVYKTAYQGGTYVGNDCQKILQNAD